MIADAIEFIRKEVRRRLGIADGEVLAIPARALADAANTPGVCISLINLQEETALRNTPHAERRALPLGSEARYLEPPVFLNLYLLFAFNFPNYATSLVHLSKTIELFQSKTWFSSSTQTGPGALPFPSTLEKLVFALENLRFEELNNLWSMLGGTHFPSVVYKVRMVKVQLAETSPVPEVRAIELNTVIR